MVKKFLLSAAIFASSWLLLYHGYIRHHTRVDPILSKTVAENSSLLLSFFNPDYHVTFTQRGNYMLNTVCYKDNCLVGVGRPCNGLELFVLFTGFIVCFPGPVKHKWWYIPSGVLLIHLLNVSRVAALAVIQQRWPQYLDFNHKYTFTILVYAVVFGLWMLWVNRFSGIYAKKS